MPNVIAADKTAMVAAFIPQKTNPPITRLIIGVVGTPEANVFTVLACEAEVVLRIVVQSEVSGGPRPYPIATLREKLEDDGVGGFIGQLERRIACRDRHGPNPDNQQKTENNCP